MRCAVDGALVARARGRASARLQQPNCRCNVLGRLGKITCRKGELGKGGEEMPGAD